MGQFLGFVALGGTLPGTLITKNTSGTPTDATSLPTFRVYGPSGVMANGTGTASFKDSGSITAATNASPIVITSAGHNLSSGALVTISGVLGNTAANGTFTVTVVDGNTFSLNGSTGNGTWTSGGTWHITGLYTFTATLSGANGYAQGINYSVLANYTVSGTAMGDLSTFQVY